MFKFNFIIQKQDIHVFRVATNTQRQHSYKLHLLQYSVIEWYGKINISILPKGSNMILDVIANVFLIRYFFRNVDLKLGKCVAEV